MLCKSKTRAYNKQEVLNLFSISYVTLWRWLNKNTDWYDPDFPRPFARYPNSDLMFDADEIDAYYIEFKERNRR